MGKTKIILKNLNPEWNESFNLALNINDNIEFKMYDHDRFMFDDFMGTCHFKIDE